MQQTTTKKKRLQKLEKLVGATFKWDATKQTIQIQCGSSLDLPPCLRFCLLGSDRFSLYFFFFLLFVPFFFHIQLVSEIGAENDTIHLAD